MKDIAGQDIHLGDRVAHLGDGSTVVHIGRVADILHLTNQVEIDVELTSMNYSLPKPPDPRFRQVRAGRYRVVVIP